MWAAREGVEKSGSPDSTSKEWRWSPHCPWNTPAYSSWQTEAPRFSSVSVVLATWGEKWKHCPLSDFVFLAFLPFRGLSADTSAG